jgi:hypothetical protein
MSHLTYTQIVLRLPAIFLFPYTKQVSEASPITATSRKQSIVDARSVYNWEHRGSIASENKFP